MFRLTRFADLQEELCTHLLGKDGGQGAFARYATTYATTALSQFTGQNNKLLTDDLGCEWFMYTGSNKETSREFCIQLTAKKFIHKSEIPTILTGRIDDYQCAIYEKTGLPYGMIEGTTADNFQCNCGGWNCRHQLVPIADALVPAALRAKFTKRQTAEKQAEALRKDKNYTDVQTNAAGGLKATHKGHITHSSDKEQTFFADHLTSTDLELKCQDQLYRMGHTAILRDESKKDENGNQIPSLELELDGKLMDIASVTNGTCGSALLNKNRQVLRCAQRLNIECDTVCIYYHEASMFSEKQLKQDIAWYHEYLEQYHLIPKLKNIHIIINGQDGIMEYNL